MSEPRIYGAWAGNPKGVKQNSEQCIEEIYPKDGQWIPWQCKRKKGFGEDGLYCKQHAKRHPESNT